MSSVQQSAFYQKGYLMNSSSEHNSVIVTPVDPIEIKKSAFYLYILIHSWPTGTCRTRSAANRSLDGHQTFKRYCIKNNVYVLFFRWFNRALHY